jgi:hypothetical protein
LFRNNRGGDRAERHPPGEPFHNEASDDPDTPSARDSPEQKYRCLGNSLEQFSALLADRMITWEQEVPSEPGIDQPVVEFPAFGAPDDMTPPLLVVRDLRESIHFSDTARWPGLLAQAQALRRQRAA